MDDRPPLAGVTVGITADRRWQEQAGLFERRGATVVHGPTMRTVDLGADSDLRDRTAELIDDPPDVLVVTTGAGFRLWLETAAEWQLADRLVAALRDAATAIVCRGAKGASAVRGAGLDVAWRAGHESMEEVVAHMGADVERGRRVAIQLFDPDDHWATIELRQRFAGLIEVPVYRWRLPDDIGPANALVEAALAGRLDAVTFTSQPAVRFLFALASESGLEGRLRDAFARDVLAVCVGPVCAEALVECGVERTVWPDPPRLVPMVRLAEEHLVGR